MATRIQLRRGTSQQWALANPLLAEGEIGIELDTRKIKIGNGLNWNSITQYANVVPSDLAETLSAYVTVSDIGAASGVVGLDSNKNALVPGASVIFEGISDNEFETILQVQNPTQDRTVTVPDNSGTIALTSDITNNTQNIGIKTNNLEAVVTGIEQQTTVDSALESEWRTLKYLIQMTYSGEIHSTEVLIANDSADLLMSQYGDVYSSSELATVTATKSGGTINLIVTPKPGKNPLVVRFFRTGIKS